MKRVATLMAALGALTLSTGAAMLVTAQSASAEKTPVNICHATSSDSNPYTFITVDNDSVKKLAAHLAHRDEPNKRWKSDGTFNNIAHVKNEPKPDIIGDYLDEQGDPVVMDGIVNAARCNGDIEVEVPDEPTNASVTFTDPSCANQNEASYDTEGENADFVLDGVIGAGESVTVTATVKDGFTFPDDAQVLEFKHTFAEEADCSEVEPPGTPEEPETPPVVATPTVVHAGLTGATVTNDLRSEQGLALLVSGMVMMLIAGGLVLRPAGGRTRS